MAASRVRREACGTAGGVWHGGRRVARRRSSRRGGGLLLWDVGRHRAMPHGRDNVGADCHHRHACTALNRLRVENTYRGRRHAHATTGWQRALPPPLVGGERQGHSLSHSGRQVLSLRVQTDCSTTSEGAQVVGCETLPEPPSAEAPSVAGGVVSHGCARSLRAVGRTAVSFLKHCIRKSVHRSEMPGGSGGQFSWTMRKSADMGASSKKGGAPEMSSITVQPTDQTSLAVVKPDIWMISGAIQYGVPTTELACADGDGVAGWAEEWG